MNKRILILGNSRLVVFGFRGEIIEALVAQGYDVYVSFPSGPFGEGQAESEKYGCHYLKTEINRRGKSVFQDYGLLRFYRKTIAEVNPAYVLSFTAKCNAYGGLAAARVGVPYAANITGLGTGLVNGGMTAKILSLLYKRGLRKADQVFFQNQSDQKYFNDHRLYSGPQTLLPGSGVNLRRFHPTDVMKSENDPIVFLYLARVMRAKGIDEFLYAARRAKEEGVNAVFRVAGYCEESYAEVIVGAQNDGVVEYLGLVNDVLPHMHRCDCLVLPSFHPEGVSNALLEAAACAKPIITTHNPGCAVAVDDGVSGILIDERDAAGLYKAVKSFCALSLDERRAMGAAGRKKVEQQFDRKVVVDAYMNVIERCLEKGPETEDE